MLVTPVLETALQEKDKVRVHRIGKSGEERLGPLLPVWPGVQTRPRCSRRERNRKRRASGCPVTRQPDRRKKASRRGQSSTRASTTPALVAQGQGVRLKVGMSLVLSSAELHLRLSKGQPSRFPAKTPGMIGTLLGLVGSVSVYCDGVGRSLCLRLLYPVWQHLTCPSRHVLI